MKWPTQTKPLGSLGNVYVSKGASRPQPGETGRRSLTLSRDSPRPPGERAALLFQMASAEEYKTKSLAGSAVLLPGETGQVGWLTRGAVKPTHLRTP